MIIPVTHILPSTSISRRRFLPVAGNVLVYVGQQVQATDVIAEAVVAPKHISLDIARGLGVPPDMVKNYLHREIGDLVPEKGVIASRKGLVSRMVRAPRAGTLVAIGGGQALLQVSSPPFQLIAGLPGTVVSVEAGFGAVIETSGVWVQGVWGNGLIAFGNLKVLADSPDHILTDAQLDSDSSGTIALAGHCSEPQVLEKGRVNQLGGLILGSMATRLMPLAARMPYPIMVIDGFGSIPFNQAAFNLLSGNTPHQITLNATQYDLDTGDRPEIVIPHPEAGGPPVPLTQVQLETGAAVRVLRAPHQSKSGTVSRLLSDLHRFPNGLRHEAVEIEFENQEKAVVPVANIEVIG